MFVCARSFSTAAKCSQAFNHGDLEDACLRQTPLCLSVCLSGTLPANSELTHETILIFGVYGIYDEDLAMLAIFSDGLVYRSP